MRTTRVKNLTATKRLARALAKELRARKSAVVLLYGEMGAGKTTLIREIIKNLNPAARVSSPTFTIINKYAENLYHADLYRIENAKELENTDFYEIIAGENIIFVEWAERLDAEIDGAIKIEIKGGANENERNFIIS
ncbi:MAG: tRNA (adenosine(37)-N6)-threonylcarbamoyltransferase complex ATPase subunit type 1 TsaE [Christensenellaceae bacterium]|jgi:tRNA threonylcarbamoyladenosine biosynthesis protein TsaE|nr:tRNA (adenosine(37)-N6)-threonylcarbamoyltransferase complex ATPase subunit type 1 TsaE [Christensenellaceae bacterium]